MRATSREDSGELGTTAPGWARGDRIQAERHGIHDHRELVCAPDISLERLFGL